MHNYDYWGTAPLPKLKVLYKAETGGVARVIFNRDSGYLEESNYKAPHNFKVAGPFTVTIINEGVLPQTSGALFLQVSWL